MADTELISQLCALICQILLPAAFILWIGKLIAEQKGKGKIAGILGRIALLCAIIGGAALLYYACWTIRHFDELVDMDP